MSTQNPMGHRPWRAIGLSREVSWDVAITLNSDPTSYRFLTKKGDYLREPVSRNRTDSASPPITTADWAEAERLFEQLGASYILAHRHHQATRVLFKGTRTSSWWPAVVVLDEVVFGINSIETSVLEPGTQKRRASGAEGRRRRLAREEAHNE